MFDGFIATPTLVVGDVHVVAINTNDPELIWTLDGHIVTAEAHDVS